ncbi:MAG: type II secretion system F family protein [Lentisphaeria bacterium]|jgi:tight adherence protein B|nr:type II secretion system F family protein [Lentisphaeria bacterium]
MFSNSFWVGLCAFAAVTLAMLGLIDFGIYVAKRYRERYLEEAKTELDDILIQLPANRLLDLSITLSAIGAIVTVVLVSTKSEQMNWSIGVLAALVVGGLLFPIPRVILRLLKKQRLVKFNIQLEDALGMMSSSLKAGFSINQALEKVSEQDMHPIALEFRLLMQELQLGVPLDQALDNMARRIGSEDFELVATAIITARQTGGELTETLERVAALIRERGRISAKVRALTAMGRLQAIMIGAMPFLLLFGMYHISPAMMDSFVGSFAGVISISVVVILVICGFLTIRKITNVEV